MGLVDVTRAMDLTERLTAIAKAHCKTAEDLRRIASALRGRVSTEVRRHPYRRAFRLARSGSDGPPATDGSKETTERRCPYCKGERGIKPLGRVQIEAGLVRSAHCCASCDRAFVYVPGRLRK